MAHLDVHEGRVLTVAYSPDGARIVTASDDGTARIWDGESGKELVRLKGHEGEMLDARFLSDGVRVVTMSSGEATRVWSVFAGTQALVKAAKNRLPRCLTREQRAAYFLPTTPPQWCIERGRWPYQTNEWQAWLADLQAGRPASMPPSTYATSAR